MDDPRIETHQVGNIDHAYFQAWRVLTEQPGRRYYLQRGNITGRGEDHIRLALPIVAGPGPNRGTDRTVFHCRLHLEPLELGLLIDDDEVDVVAAPKTMVSYRQQA